MSQPDKLSRWTWAVVLAAALAYGGFAFFFWHFVDWLTPFLAPSLWPVVGAIILLALLFAIVLPIRRWHTRRLRSLLPLLTLIVLLGVAQLIDFTRLWLRVNFTLGRSSREKVVRQIAAGELRPNVQHNDRLIRLPDANRKLSLGGGEVVVEGDRVLFYTFRGVLDNFAGFVYSPDDAPPGNGDFAGDFFITEKIADRWYYVSAR